MAGNAVEQKGASHGPWKDETCCEKSSDIHAPRYFKSYDEFGAQLKAFPDELMLKDFLTEEMYNKYKDTKTSLGVTLDKCIKGGVDKVQLGPSWNVGKVGFLLGDAECVTTFSELVKPIMLARHGNPTLPHPAPNLDGSKLLDHSIIDDKYVISTRVRTGRSISGFPLPPSIGHDQRVELEGIAVKALSTLTGELKGDYYPLAGSNTYKPKPNGIDKATEERLVSDHFLFQEPDEPMLLSWRMERDWPQARGIYHNEAKTALVWVNEEDHLRVISMQKGKDIRQVFDRFASLVKAVEGACVTVGRKLEIDATYGNILSCPSNCGTGLRASMMLKVPLATKEPNFKAWLAERHLQARGSGGFASAAADDGIRDVSNVDRMGKDEVTLVNEMIKGVADLIVWEKELEKTAMAKQERVEQLLADAPELPRCYEVAGGIDLVNGLYEMSLLEDGDAIPEGRGGYGGREFAATPVDKRYHWVKKEPEETGTEIWWSTSWCWGLSYKGDHHYCDEGGSSIAAHKALALRDTNRGRLPRPLFVPRTRFGNPMGADESWSPVTLTPIFHVKVLQLAAAPGDGGELLVTATTLTGEEVAQVPLADGEGAQELRQKICGALSLGIYSVKAVLPSGELLRNVGSAGQLRELLVAP